MTSPSTLTDPAARAQRLHRANAKGMFLHRTAADEVIDRLTMVNKAFNKPAIVTSFPDFWNNQIPNAITTIDSDILELGEKAHDLVVHAMSLHWSNDPVGQLIQCRRALKNDGLLIATTFGGQTLNELRSCLAEAEIAVTGGVSPRILPMGEVRDLGDLLQRAGLALPVADSIVLNVTYDDLWHLMRDLRAMGETNALVTRLRTSTRRQVFDLAAELYRKHFTAEDGRIRATFEIIFLTGWAPDASQPKALRPGSAKHRLADALGTSETQLLD